MRILVVDDEAVICQGIQIILEEEGHSVDTAVTYQDGLRQIKEQKYDIALIDLMLPKTSGNDLIKILTKDHPETTVIMITGYNTIEIAFNSLRYGAFDFIPKPFTDDELTHTLKKSVKRALLDRKTLKELYSMRPKDFYYLNDHLWLRVDSQNNVTTGIDVIFQKVLEGLVKVDLPEKGEKITQGIPFGNLTDRESNIHALLSPISGTVTEKNNNPSIADITGEDMYKNSWLLKIYACEMEKELQNLKTL